MGDKFLDPISRVIPGLRENSGKRQLGVQLKIPFAIGPLLHVDGATYKQVVFIAPVGNCEINEIWVSAAVKAAGGTNTLAFDNYDASGNAARNVLSTTNIDPTAVPATVKEGTKLTLTATLTDRKMDEGDVLNYTLVVGTESTQGEGYAGLAVITIPDLTF